MLNRRQYYTFGWQNAGELRSRYKTSKSTEHLEASEEIIQLAKRVLSEQEFLEAEDLAKKLIGKKSEKAAAKARLMELVKPPPKRPLYYAEWEIQFLPRWTRTLIKYLGDFVDILMKTAVFEKARNENIFHMSMGQAINKFERTKPNCKTLIENLKSYNQFLYRDAKHDFKLPQGRTEHRFTSREVVLTIFITVKIANEILEISPMSKRVREDKKM